MPEKNNNKKIEWIKKKEAAMETNDNEKIQERLENDDTKRRYKIRLQNILRRYKTLLNKNYVNFCCHIIDFHA